MRLLVKADIGEGYQGRIKHSNSFSLASRGPGEVHMMHDGLQRADGILEMINLLPVIRSTREELTP